MSGATKRFFMSDLTYAGPTAAAAGWVMFGTFGRSAPGLSLTATF